jgi:hypothetical protein
MSSAVSPVTSRVLPLEQVFRLGAFAPASVQRDYQWRTSNCLALLNDIDRTFAASSFAQRDKSNGAVEAEVDTARVTANDDTVVTSDDDEALPPLDVYMLGAIVLTPPEQNRYAIYDGLQRLTTLTILLAVLRDLTKDKTLLVRLDGLVRMDTGQMRIILAGRDPTLVTQIQPRGEAIKNRRGATKTDMGRRIRIAAQLFREKLKPWTGTRRDAFTRFLIEQVHIDVQVAADARLARQIFVTTNTRGRPLDRIDLFKGQLTDIADTEARAAQVVSQWNALRSMMGEKLDDLLTAADFIERQAPQGSDCLNALADHLAKTRGPEKIESFMTWLAALGADYLAMQEVLSAPPTDALSANIWRLQILRWHQWRPLALLWYSDYRRAVGGTGAGNASKVEAANRRFEALHKRCIAVVLAGFSMSDRETIFGRAISQAKAGNNPLSATGALAFKDVHLARISDALRLPLTDTEVRSTLLRWTESVLHGAVPPAHVKDATVEHILPRRPAANSSWVVDFPDKDARYFACHTLGNLAALDKFRNEKIKNAVFAEKRPVFAEATAEHRTLEGIAGLETWSREAIDARTTDLAGKIEAFLDLPPPQVSATSAPAETQSKVA